MSAAASAPRRLLRSSAPKQQPKQTEKQPKQTEKQPKQTEKQPKQQPKQQQEKQEEEVEDASRMHGFERLLDVNYAGEQWAEARVLDLDAAQRRLFVHYMGWNARYDAWVGLDVIAAHGAHTKAAPKKKTSWDGKQSLFEVGDGPAATHSKRKRPSPRARLTAKAKTDSRKRTASEDTSSSQVYATPAKSPRAARKQEKPAAEDGAAAKDASPSASPKAVRVTRSRAAKVKPEPVSVRDAPATNDKCNGAAEDADAHTETPSEGEKVTPIEVRLPTRRRAASKQKSRTKKKNDDESSTSEYSDHEDSEVEEEDDASDDEELQELRKRRKRIDNGEESEEELVELDFETKRPAKAQRVSTRRGTSKANVPHQRVPLACAESAATRERLADFFRQRVFQQQLMHVARVGQTAPVVTIAPPPTSSTAKKPSQSRKVADQSESKEEADPTSAQASISEAQLAAYYHYQMMLAQAYMAADPKELQARAAAFEEQRRLQVQEYYRQLEVTRKKNAKLIDDAQEFMAKSTETWEKQTQSLMDPTSSGGASALKNWDEMAKSLQNGKPKEEEEDGDDSRASKKPEGETDGEAERDADKSDDGEDSGESPADASARELVRVGEQKAKPDAALAKAAGKPSGASGDVLYEFVL